MNQSTIAKLAKLAERAIPFLRDEGAKYEDDGSNEPLELARDIEQALSEHGEVVVTTDQAGRCVAVTRQDAEGRILSTIWEASEHGGGGEAVAYQRNQPCGCVMCVCADERQCHGCGAKHCGNRVNHPPYVRTTPPTPSAPVGVEAVLRRIVAEADTHPFNPIGHVIEHVVPEARNLHPPTTSAPATPMDLIAADPTVAYKRGWDDAMKQAAPSAPLGYISALDVRNANGSEFATVLYKSPERIKGGSLAVYAGPSAPVVDNWSVIVE